MVGGFPRALTRMIRVAEGRGAIEDLDEDYTSAYDLLLRDAGKFGIDEEHLEFFIRGALLDPVKRTSYGGLSSIIVPGGKRKGVGHGRQVGLGYARKMLSYLVDGSRYLTRLRSIRPPSLDRTLSAPSPDPLGEIKLIYTDPLLFHSLFWVSQGVTRRIAEHARSIIEPSPGMPRSGLLASGLLEATVCSHVARINLLTQSDDVGNYGFWMHGGREAFDCVSWWIDAHNARVVIVPVEATWSSRKALDKRENAAATLSAFKRRLIVAVGEKRVKPRLESRGDIEFIVLPAPLFLAII